MAKFYTLHLGHNRRIENQHYTYKFFVRTSIRQLFSSYVSSYVFALAKNLYEKCPLIMLMKLTAGELKIYHAEVAHKMLVKMTPYISLFLFNLCSSFFLFCIYVTCLLNFTSYILIQPTQDCS